jgi:4-carboxymuconolactone decarboxylase
MPESELYRKGQALRGQLMGEALTEQMNQSTYSDPVMQKFRDLTTETVFGALWARPGLDHKTRALICVVSDAATGWDPELALHLRMALRQGWTEHELTEALLHLLGYVGAPAARDALLVASRVFKEVKAGG